MGTGADKQSASPAFIYLFAILLFFAIKPCGYCLALVSLALPFLPSYVPSHTAVFDRVERS